MTHTLEVSCRSLTYPEMCRDTVFTIIVHPEMCRDTVFTIAVIFPDMYHDTVSLVVSSPFFPAFCVSAVARALPCVCLVIRTHVSLPMFHLKVHCRKCPSNVETSLLEGIPCHEVVQRTLGKYAALSGGVD